MAKSTLLGKPYPEFSVKEELDLLHQEQLEDQEYMRDLFADYDESEWMDDEEPTEEDIRFDSRWGLNPPSVERKLTPEEADDLIRHIAPDGWDDGEPEDNPELDRQAFDADIAEQCRKADEILLGLPPADDTGDC